MRHLFERSDPTEPIGLSFRADRTARPSLLVSVSAPRALRVAIQERPLLWARLHEDHYGYELLRAPGRESPCVLPPLPAELVRQHAEGAPGGLAWAKTYAGLLRESSASPLYEREWYIGSPRVGRERFELAASVVRQVVEQRAHGDVQWDIGKVLYPITLRDLSTPDAGRVKFWRKHAKAATLPPILLWWVSGLDCYVVLDGHDRLLAASLENLPVPALALEPLDEVEPSEEKQRHVTAALATALDAAERAGTAAREAALTRVHRPFTTEDANRMLLDAFTPRQQLGRSRAFRLPGGKAQWLQEVRDALIGRGIGDSRLLRAG